MMNGPDKQSILTPPGERGKSAESFSNIDVSFEKGVRGAKAKVSWIHSVRNGGTGLTLEMINAEEAHLAASLSGLGGGLMGLAWISISRSVGSKLAYMEVVMGEKTPPIPWGFEVLALLKVSRREEGQHSDSSDSEEETIEMPFQIFVRFHNGKSYTYEVYSNTTVLELQKMLQRKHQIPPEQQRLLFGGKQLVADKTLGFYNITAESTLDLVGRLRGG